MNELTKNRISEALRGYCDRYESQNKAANSLKGVSAATISHMLSGKWELIKETMWRHVAAQIGYTSKEWVAVETRDYKIMSRLLADAQDNAMVYAVTGDAGTGKTFAARKYVETHKNAYLLCCADYWTKKMFLQELLSAMGRESGGYTIAEMMGEVVRQLKAAESPMIVLDEADKLNDQVLYFFITLYNQLEDHCGIVLCATDHLAKRIDRGRKLNKKGYKEMYSRVGRKFIELKGLGAADVSAVCRANGIDDAVQIKEVIDDCEGDLRRVKRKIHALKSVNK